MIVRRHIILVLTIALIIWANPGSGKGERWSRQVSNSEWIPLANPRSLQLQSGGIGGGGGLPGIASNPGQPQLQPLALPPALREQYHQQLLQLQETQDSIQKLLQLQQQLRAQQQLLQSQSYLPEGFSTDEDRKAALHQSTFANVQSLPHIAPGALLPPPPGSQPQPPEFAAQDFLLGNQHNEHVAAHNVNVGEKQNSADKNEEQFSTQGAERTRDFTTRQNLNYKKPKQLREDQNGEQFISQTTVSSIDTQNDGEEEVQLLYVPAETLAQRDHQQKVQRVRNRKNYSSQPQQQQQQLGTRQQNRYQQQQQQQQQQQEPAAQEEEEIRSQGLEGTRPSTAQQTFAHQVLYQLQQEQAKRTRIQQEEREKELARLAEEQKELERQAKLHQELVFKEQDLRRQKELALRKELERQEEEARQKELQRIKESNQRKLLEEEAARKKEVERQEELERQKIEEIRAQDYRKQKEAEVRQAEIDRLAALERQKEFEIRKSLEQQQELERQQAEAEAIAQAELEAQRQAQAQAQLEAHRKAHQDAIDKQRQAQIDAAKLDAKNRAQNQAQQQHLTETTRPKNSRLKSRQRQRNRQENQTTTPSPNQPPLSVYMGRANPIANPEDLKVSDVLTILKDAKTISVLDSVGPNTPQVFVGPTNLEPPIGYAKFDLPYLSAIDNNRVERKVDKLPFFVAPLSFKPPPGYSKIPFPAPHIGSVVVNTLDNEQDPLDGPAGGILKTDEDLQPNPTPLIEPNSYAENSQLPTVNSYDQHVTAEYSHEALVATTTPRYEVSYSSTPSSGSRYRHRQFYNDRTPHIISTAIYGEHSTTEPAHLTRTKFRQFYKQEQGHESSSYNEPPTASPQPVYQQVTTTPLPQDNLQQNFAAVNGGEHGESVTERYNVQSLPDQQQSVRNSFNDLSQAHVATQSDFYNPGSQEARPEFGDIQNNQNQFVPGPEDSRLTSGPTQYTIQHSELPRISPQLPGLVNSLIEEQNIVENTPSPLTITSTTTTTTTTTEPPTTTYRSRGRQRGRIVPTRAPTSTESTPTRSAITERSRRPYSRSRVRQGQVSTTETYQETVYDPTKSRLSGTQEKTHYVSEVESQRKPVPRNQRYRGRGSDRNAVQQEARPDAALSDVEQNPPSQESNYANNPLRNTLREPLPVSAPVQNLNSPIYQEEVYLSSGNPSHSAEHDKLKANSQPLQVEVGGESAVAHEADIPVQHGVQDIQGINYLAGFKTSNFGQTNIDQSPVNGFNYQSQNDKFQNIPEATISPQQFPVNNFDGQRSQGVEPIYNFHGNQATDSPGEQNVNSFPNADLNQQQIYGSQDPANPHSLTDSDNPKPVGPQHQTDIRPVYNHQNDFLEVSSTTTETPEVTTAKPILTPAPLNGRQRLRGRPNQNAQRVHHVDSAIQTRPTGSRDEFVRFSAVNQNVKPNLSSGRIQPGGNRQRLRNRGHQVNNQNIQTEGDDYVRIQSPVHRPVTTTTTTTTTTEPTANYAKETEEDIEYGFIRPPSFKPIHPVGDNRAVANPQQIYKPKYEQTQAEEPTNHSPVEVMTPQTQILQNRQRYNLANRRPLTRSTTPAPPPTTTASEIQAKDVYGGRQKSENDEFKGDRIRGRVRRPGKRRTTTTSTTTTTTTTTTESVLDSNNELPLDENYPRIIQGVPPAPLGPPEQRRTLFDEELKSPNLETLPQAIPLQRPAPLHSLQHQESPQFPRQDFVLNFGVGSENEEGHEEYDQTQLGSSIHPKKYSSIIRLNSNAQPNPASLSIADIEGAESQWSTKLTHSSFQPISLINQIHDVNKNNERQEKSEDSFDIITAGPDLASADGSVTPNHSNTPRDIVVNASYLGNTEREESRVKKNWENSPSLQGRSIVEQKNDTFKDDSSSLDSLQFWNTYGNSETDSNNAASTNYRTTTYGITEEVLITTTEKPETETGDVTSSTNSVATDEPITTRRVPQRRRRVRVRVRPVEDIVSAESQHVGAAWNSLTHGKPSNDKIRSPVIDSKTTTVVPPTSSTTERTTEKSFFDELLDEMTEDLPVAHTSTDISDITEPTTNESSSKINEQSETTTPKMTTSSPRITSTSPDSLTTTVEHETTEEDNFPPKSTEIKKLKIDQPSFEHDNKFRPKHGQTVWWNHNYNAVTKSPMIVVEEDKTVALDPEESSTVKNTEEKESASEHSLSDYVNAFFKTMEGGGREEGEDGESDSALSVFEVKKDGETVTTLETISKDQEKTVSGFTESTTVYEVQELTDVKNRTNIEDALPTTTTTPNKIEEIITTPEQDTTANSPQNTTPEVPYSPEELTTEIPSTTPSTNTPTTTTTTTTKTDKNYINNNDQNLKILRTSTTTEVSHMTEICFRGRCVKTKSRKEIRRR